MPLAAPGALGAQAAGVAQLAGQRSGPWKLVPDPGGQDRVAAGHGEPGQGEGQVPAVAAGLVRYGPGLLLAGAAPEQVVYDRAGLRAGGPVSLSEVGKDPVEAGVAVGGGQPVPGGEQVGCGVGKGILLVGEEVEGELAVQVGVVSAAPAELALLVVLHQVVVGVAREGQRVESQRVHCREVQQLQVRFDGRQVEQVESENVVTQQEVRALSQVVQPGQGGGAGLRSVGESQGLAGVRAYCREGVDALVFDPYFEVQGETAG